MKKKKEDIELGNRIKKIRSDLNLGQKDLAEKIGASVSAVSNWENGRNKPNSIMLYRIAELADITVDELHYGFTMDVEDYAELKIYLLREQLKKEGYHFLIAGLAVDFLKMNYSIPLGGYVNTHFKNREEFDKDLERELKYILDHLTDPKKRQIYLLDKLYIDVDKCFKRYVDSFYRSTFFFEPKNPDDPIMVKGVSKELRADAEQIRVDTLKKISELEKRYKYLLSNDKDSDN